MSHSRKRKGINPFLSMMSRETRSKLSIESQPYACPFPSCSTRKTSYSALQGSRVGHLGTMPKVQPSARSDSVLDPKLKIEKHACEVVPEKKKILPQEQRENAASRPRHGFKKLPEGWTRQKVARAYNDAPLRGIPKSLFLQKWAEKYDFPLSQQKAAKWVELYINNDKDTHSDSEDSFNESD